MFSLTVDSISIEFVLLFWEISIVLGGLCSISVPVGL